MNYRFLKETEVKVQSETDAVRKQLFDKIPDLIDSLFEASYFIGWDPFNSSDSIEHNYQVFANPIYQSVPYSMRVIEMLIKKGYYLESMILMRTLFEMFVKLRYFFNHKEKCLEFAQGVTKIQYKIMFEEFAPGLYKILYSKMLSEFAHGGFAIGIFHNKIDFSPNNIQPIQGCFYNEFLSNLPVNASIQLYYAHLNYLPILFNKYKETVPEEINQKRLDNLKWLDNRINEHINKHPNVKEFKGLLDPLIRS